MNAPLYDPDDVAFARGGRKKRRTVYISGPTVYIVGPMAGMPGNNRYVFDAAAADLRGRGFEVINPAELDLEAGFDPSTDSPEDFDVSAVIIRDVGALLDCDAIAMLPGHEDSKGATAERHLAIWAGIPVLSYPSMALLGEESLESDKPSVGPVDGETVTNAAGAKQSHLSARFDCIPPVVLRLLAQCLGFGARKYGKDNWQGLPIDDNLCHCLNHINEFRAGDASEPHLVNAMARLTFALSQAVDAGRQADAYVHPEMIATD